MRLLEMSGSVVFRGSTLRSLFLSSLMVLAAVAASSAPARAGICYEMDEIEASLKAFERFAKKGGKVPEGEWWCTADMPKLLPRLAAACQSVVVGYQDREVAYDHPDRPLHHAKSTCVLALLKSGIVKVGDVDTLAILLDRGKWGVTDSVASRMKLLAGSGDARAREFVVEKMRAHLDAVGKKKLTGWRAGVWLEWQLGALRVLEQLGAPSDVALIDEIAASGKDKQLAKLAKKAKAAIEARSASAP